MPESDTNNMKEKKKELLLHEWSVKSMTMTCGSNTVEQQKEQFLLNIAELKTAPYIQAECKVYYYARF